MLRLLAWLVVAVLLGAAAFELALALGAGSFGPEPGDDVPGSEPVFAVATLVAAAVAAFMVAHSFTYDAYYAPQLRRTRTAAPSRPARSSSSRSSRSRQARSPTSARGSEPP